MAAIGLILFGIACWITAGFIARGRAIRVNVERHDMLTYHGNPVHHSEDCRCHRK